VIPAFCIDRSRTSTQARRQEESGAARAIKQTIDVMLDSGLGLGTLCCDLAGRRENPVFEHGAIWPGQPRAFGLRARSFGSGPEHSFVGCRKTVLSSMPRLSTASPTGGQAVSSGVSPSNAD
jgi:hypothetical protein